ncbi:peptidylprolyl isomerase [Amaricoccus tamworthensis]|uniref:peptidylprolyl isomerase n=1 Tax=Amaricoccus tamworthensis TaxID=57002 RepID=UPI003C7AD654
MRSLLTSTALAGLLTVSAAFAQDAEYDASTVLADVDGTEITLGHLIATYDRLPENYRSIPAEQVFPGLLEQLIDQTLVANEQMEELGERPYPVQIILENESRTLMAGVGLEEILTGPVEDAEVEADYEEFVENFAPGPEFNASHILVSDEELATSLKAEIDGGRDFAEVAVENSSDGSAANGGELGWFGLGQMVPEFEGAVREMSPGEVAGPVQTQFGWHLIKLNDTRETEPPAIEEVRSGLENQVRMEKLQDKLDGLRENATIDIPEHGVPAAAIQDSSILER